MNDQKHGQIARLGWDELEERLQPGTRGARAEATHQALRDYFGDEEYEKLRELAAQSRAVRARRAKEKEPPLGNIVLLPGIMGSNLTRVEQGDQDLIWVHFLRLIRGALSELRLGKNGKDSARPGLRIEPTDVDKRTYARAVLKLRARWRVEPFPYDWRKDVDEASDRLSRFIRERFGSQPVNLVAHSMGGLVARNFIHRHPGQWEALREDGRGGRLIMLGTPNYGSFSIAQVLTGAESLVVLLSRADLRNNLNEIVEIIDSFLGCYLMLPAPDRIPALTQALYDRATWAPHPVSETHLERARRFHEGLKDPATIDPLRMTYIAGCNRSTLSGLEVLAPGEFRYLTTLEGDGRVTHQLGLLDGVRTYYVDEVHGDLTKNDQVLQAVEEILQRGLSSLPERPPAPRAMIVDGGRWSRSISEYQAAAQLEEFARRVESREVVSADETRALEETLMRAAIGGEPAVRGVATLRAAQQRSAKKDRPRFEIEVRHEDVTKVVAPVVVAGHYKGVKPINALAILDRALGNWISLAKKFTMLGGDLGRLFFIPIKHDQIASEALLLAGMGEEGKFGADDLRYLILNVTYGISALQEKSFATLLIGAGAGNLNVDQAVRGMVYGVCDALKRLPPRERIERVTIVELDYQRCLEIHDQIARISREDGLGVEVKLTPAPGALKENVALRGAQSRLASASRSIFGARITVERDGDFFRFSALTKQAVIPVREVEIQSFFPDQISERLRGSHYRQEQERLGRLLTTTLVPEDFLEVLDQPGPLTLILDRATASIPWEMAAFVKPSGTNFLGPDLQLTRQFRTFLSPPPGIAPANNDRLRVLVIADPAPEPEYQLPGARREGREVVRLLNRIKTVCGLEIEVIDRIGDAECDPVDILSLILDGGFDVIHYAGHGEFNAESPKRGGWIFGRNLTLSSREIFRARRVPRLIFANACYSAVVNPGPPLTPAEMNRGLAGIAEAFFERGVQNYIGSGWPVSDELAVRFALTFYSWALTGRMIDQEAPPKRGRGAMDQSPEGELIRPEPKPLYEALGQARRAIAHEGSTWGAYHHYGQASDYLMVLNEAARPAPTAPPARRKSRRSSAKKKSAGKKATGAKKGAKKSDRERRR